MHIVQGGCHCGNLTYRAEFPKVPSTYFPRACDCGLCASHGASYVSDPDGRLAISIKTGSQVSRYRQGSRIADFLICKTCGVLVGVSYEEGGRLYASINARSAYLSDFAEPQTVSLTQLADDERTRRWKRLWFSDVRMELNNA